jgi:hypothetical protein
MIAVEPFSNPDWCAPSSAKKTWKSDKKTTFPAKTEVAFPKFQFLLYQ